MHFFECLRDDDEDWKDNSEILGSWTENTDQYEYFEFQFFDDNTGCEICHWGRNSNIDYYFTYRYNAKTKEVFIQDEGEEDHYCTGKKIGNRLVLDDSKYEGYTLFYAGAVVLPPGVL